MCDYSLMHIASRPATVGDKLTSARFLGYSQGFASADEVLNEYGNASTAVCVLPGTEIGFDAPIKTRGYWESEPKTYERSVGIFRQVDKDNPHTHHDALELPDGTIVKLHALELGQLAIVLQLPAAPKTEAEVKEQERLAVVA